MWSHLKRWAEEEVRREEEEVKDGVGECTSRISPDIRDQVSQRNKWDDDEWGRGGRNEQADEATGGRILGLCRKTQLLDEGGEQRAGGPFLGWGEGEWEWKWE